MADQATLFGPRRTQSRGRFFGPGFGFSLPWIIGFLLFTAGPLLASFYYSFTNADIFQSPVWVGLANYRALLKDGLFFSSVWNTVYVAVIGVPLTLALALLLAIALSFPVRGQPLYRAIVYLPAIVPVVATSYLFEWVLNSQNGYLDRFLAIVHLPQPDWLESPSWTRPGLLLLTLWGVGGSAVIYLAALKQVPQTRYEAAAIDGANAWQRFWHVTWPALTPVTLFLLIISSILYLQIFTQPYLIAQGTQIGANPYYAGPNNSLLTYTIYLFQNAFMFLKMGYASAMAWVLFLFIGLWTAVLLFTSRWWVHYGTDD
jgi:multiple sugar transport system permease protein